jgi:predicted enzyme related to lactoylglutathione lyase
VWTDNSGDMSETYGYLTGDTMTFISAPHLNPRGRMVVNRMRIIKKSNDELLQTGELSLDNTTTWISTFSFIYRRKTTAGLTNKPFSLEVYGMKVLVPDLVKAKSFYNETLGFPLDNLLTTDNKVVLYTNSIRLILQEDKNVQPITEKAFGPNSLTMQVNNMDSAYAALKAKGVQFIKDEKRKEGVGYSMHFVDPFGNKISLLQQTAGTVKQLAEPKIYNCGLYVSDMAKARDFYANKLGFAERSQQYLPDDMPLGYTDNKFAFMLHVKRKDMPNTNKTNMRLVFLTNNIDQAFTEIKKISPNADLKNGVIVFTDAVDIVSEVIESKF